MPDGRPTSGRVKPEDPLVLEQWLEQVVAVHIDAFRGFFLTQLGPRFLREYYRCIADYPEGILLTEADVDGCVGFVSGFIDPPRFYAALRRRRVRLGVAAALGLLARPQNVPGLMANFRRAGRVARLASAPHTAELSSLAVASSAAGRGVGSTLVRRFIASAAGAGARRVVLTTDASDNEAGNRFYVRLGFRLSDTYEARPGRSLNEYTFELRTGE